MTRGLVISAVLSAALGGAFLGAHARAQSPPEAAPQPARAASPWEYKVLLMDFSEYREKDDWKEFKEKAGGNEPKADAEFRAYVLNSLAKQGWELIQVVQYKTELGTLYLRRPRGPDSAEPGPGSVPPSAENPQPMPPDPGAPRRRR